MVQEKEMIKYPGCNGIKSTEHVALESVNEKEKEGKIDGEYLS